MQIKAITPFCFSTCMASKETLVSLLYLWVGHLFFFGLGQKSGYWVWDMGMGRGNSSSGGLVCTERIFRVFLFEKGRVCTDRFGMVDGGLWDGMELKRREGDICFEPYRETSDR